MAIKMKIRLAVGDWVPVGVFLILTAALSIGFSTAAFARAGGDYDVWEVAISGQYRDWRNDFAYRDQLNPYARMVAGSVSYATGDVSRQLKLGLEARSNREECDLDLKELVWSERFNRLVIETGKSKWVWGRGLSYIPTCPLDQDTYYWGAQTTWINAKHSIVAGAAWNRDYYNSDPDDYGLSFGAETTGYTGWVRSGWTFRQSDLTAVVSYQSETAQWNWGADFSHDLANGWEIHGGVNLPGGTAADNQGLIGGTYSGKHFYLIELYHETDNLLVLAVNNATASFGKWRWEIREVLNLNDHGEIRKFNVQYQQNSHLVPELEITLYTGPKESSIRQNPVDSQLRFKVTTKF